MKNTAQSVLFINFEQQNRADCELTFFDENYRSGMIKLCQKTSLKKNSALKEE